jgi:hypothetical protein
MLNNHLMNRNLGDTISNPGCDFLFVRVAVHPFYPLVNCLCVCRPMQNMLQDFEHSDLSLLAQFKCRTAGQEHLNAAGTELI